MMKTTLDGEYLIAAGERGQEGPMMWFELRGLKIIKDFGLVGGSEMSDLDLTADGRSVGIGTVKGGLGTFSIGAQRLVKNYGSVCKSIHS